MRKKGFTLIEILVALMIIMIIAATVFPAFGVTGQVNQAANSRLQAQEIAQKYMEYMLYTAKEHSRGKSELITQLQANTEFGTFTSKSATEYEVASGKYLIELKFVRDDKLVKLKIVMKQGQEYETMDWLRYED